MTTGNPNHDSRGRFTSQNAREQHAIGAIEQALRSSKYEDFEAAKEAHLTAKVKTNRKGEVIVTLREPGVKTKRTVGSVELSVTAPKKQVVNLGVLTSADTSDKNLAMRYDRFNVREESSIKAKELYGDAVDVKVEIDHNQIAITDLQQPESFAGKGVDKHILESIIFNSREDLYDFTLDESVPYEVAEQVGFQPNPYYWAGREAPNGITYPSVKELDDKQKRPRRKRVTNPDGTTELKSQDGNRYEFRGLLMSTDRVQDKAYIRRRPGIDFRFDDMDFYSNAEPSREEKQAVWAKQAERREAWDARRKELTGWYRE